eukprot:660803-Pleurochrysis_carterae.AAC.1
MPRSVLRGEGKRGALGTRGGPLGPGRHPRRDADTRRTAGHGPLARRRRGTLLIARLPPGGAGSTGLRGGGGAAAGRRRGALRRRV